MVGLDPLYSQLSSPVTLPMVTPANILSLSFSGGLCNATHFLILQNVLFMERVVKEIRGCSRDLAAPFTSSTFLKPCYLPSLGLAAELLSASDEPNAPTESALSSQRREKIAANEQSGTAVRSIATPLSSDDK